MEACLLTCGQQFLTPQRITFLQFEQLACLYKSFALTGWQAWPKLILVIGRVERESIWEPSGTRNCCQWISSFTYNKILKL